MVLRSVDGGTESGWWLGKGIQHSYWLSPNLHSLPKWIVLNAMSETQINVASIYAMGQTSSQVKHPAPEDSLAPHNEETSAKMVKKKSKRKSRATEEAVDLEEESARALLQLRRSGLLNHGGSPSSDTNAISQQLIAEASPVQSSNTSNRKDSRLKNSEEKSKKEKKAKRRLRSSDIFDVLESEQNDHEQPAPQELPLPISPPPNNLVPESPGDPEINHSQHALDELSTDDEAARFDEAFGNGGFSGETAEADRDIFSFSQQPQNQAHQQDLMPPSYQLPRFADPTPRAPVKSGKRVKSTVSPEEDGDMTEEEAQISAFNQAGQYATGFLFGAFAAPVGPDLDIADLFGELQDHELPIDPELHSMSAFPPSVDLSGLAETTPEPKQKRKRESKRASIAPPSKRRRLEEIQSANERHMPSRSSYAVPHDQENYEHSPPRSGLPPRQISPELGTPFAEGSVGQEVQYNSGAKPAKASRKGKKQSRPMKVPKGPRESNVKDAGPGRSLQEIATNGGTFSSEEFARLDAFRDTYCEANGIDHKRFNALVQMPMRGNIVSTELFRGFHESLPYRPRMSVQRCVRRRFHNYTARGTWTEEEDEELRKAIAEKGKRWKEVGEMIDRMPGDCRDRWRDYILNAEHRNQEQWTEREIQNLCLAILECIKLMRDERQRVREEKHGKDPEDFEEDSDQEEEDLKVINWQAVSDRMGEHGGGRSRLQCSLKWSQLKRKDQDDLMNAIKYAQEAPTRVTTRPKNGWRRVRASKQIRNMRTGDRFALLEGILNSRATAEEHIPWKRLGDDRLRATWGALEKSVAWETMKSEIEEAQSMDFITVARQLEAKILSEEEEKRHDRWDPKVHGDITKRRSKKRSKARDEKQSNASLSEDNQARNKKQRVVRSELFVGEDEDEENTDLNDETGDQNRYDVLPRSAKANMYDDASRSSYVGGEDKDRDNAAGEASERDSLFDGSDDESNQVQRGYENISPELVSRVRLLQHADL